jgi:hypothetical protein
MVIAGAVTALVMVAGYALRGPVQRGTAGQGERHRIAPEPHDQAGHGLGMIAPYARRLPALAAALGPPAGAGDEPAPLAPHRGPGSTGMSRNPQPRGRATGATAPSGRIMDLAARFPARPARFPVRSAERLVSQPVRAALLSIVQEGVTNARIQGSAHVQVSVDFQDTVRISVTSRPGQAANGPLAGSMSAAPGHGLAGLRERVRAVGGTLESGRTGDGSFLITARLPATPLRGGQDYMEPRCAPFAS